jgi:hypothetical protein
MAKLKTDKLITYAYLREECDIPDLIREDELEHPIYKAQETLRMLMGDEFYQDFLLNFKNATLSAVYLLIQTYINQYVAWQANEFWTVKANFKVHASGFRVHNEPNSTPATDVQMAAIIKDAKAQAQYYKKLFVDYLNGHYSDYPLYNYACGKNLTGNSFHISAVKNKYKDSYVTKGKRCCD